MQTLLNIDKNAKTVLGQREGYLTGIMYLAPARLSGVEVCARGSTEGCRAACLNTAGRGGFNSTQAARVKKTLSFFRQRDEFMLKLHKEIGALVKKAAKMQLVPCVRLNGTSDIPWERVKFAVNASGNRWNIMEHFPQIQFYDYTKRADRHNLPVNYHLTFSLAESNHAAAGALLALNHNVAVVYRKTIPTRDSVNGTRAKVVNGSLTDLRFLDGEGVIVGLCAKGRARYDTSGFVRD